MRLDYLSGWGNMLESEAKVGALPKKQNSPQKVPFDLYPEQLSGTAFTVPRKTHLKSWLYRLLPSVKHSNTFELISNSNLLSADQNKVITPPDQMRWNPLPQPDKPTDFIEGIITMATNGSAAGHQGGAIHLYAANQSMTDHYYYNADGDWLIVPHQGELLLKTEFGRLTVKPTEIAVIQRGIRFQVELLTDDEEVDANHWAAGYICETYGEPFMLPERGPIGANSLAEERHFQLPTAWYEKKKGQFKLTAKFNGHLWQSKIENSPLDVVAWHGNYVPYKYDLSLFSPVGSVHFDHPDPSIFTVLTSPSHSVGVANIDFVIFPPRWMVAEHSFRPPYFHRNIMSEFMGLIHGEYDAKSDGFKPGGSSLHNCMTPHGPDATTYQKATGVELMPEKYDHTLAFMFESSQIWQLTEFAKNTDLRQKDYLACWDNFIDSSHA